MKAPDFELLDQTGRAHKLSDYHGKWVVLYFYPKDDTPGCTTEACSFRDAESWLGEHGLVVLGVSADSVKSHAKFAEKYDLKFALLSDPSKETVKAYKAWGPKKFMGKEYEGIIRSTYLIDPEGNIAKYYPKVTPKEHLAEIMADFTSLKS